MKLDKLISVLDVTDVYIPDEQKAREINSICHNSLEARSGSMFVCKCGAITDGHRYASSAYKSGARIFVVEKKVDLPSDAAVITVPDTSLALTRLAQIFYNFPAREMEIVGVTGTKGKTTYAVSAYLLACEYGMSAGYIGTNGVLFGDREYSTANTTPDTLELNKYLREMANFGITICFIEVSSQALWQDRINGISFDTCVFTNLYKDHIGGAEHPDFEHYSSCKKRLFTSYNAKHIITNADAPASEYMCGRSGCHDIITVSAQGKRDCSLYATDISMSRDMLSPGMCFTCHSGKDGRFSLPSEGIRMFMPFPGLFSVENALEIIATGLLIGMDVAFISEAMSKIRISGRFEAIHLSGRPGSLFIIDYAHNGISLSSVLDALRGFSPKRIICLFGSVGGRTFGRRKELGQAALAGADISIITADNPGNEDPTETVAEILKEFEGSDKQVYAIPDRREAIALAYSIAQPGDYVLLAGKGHEKYQLIGRERIPFSERDILYETDKQCLLCQKTLIPKED